MWAAFIAAFFGSLCLSRLLMAQETTSEASIGYQQYYLASGSQRIANTSGLVLGYQQFIPNVGILTVNLAPALSGGRFRTGENLFRLKGVPWQGQYWTFQGGDFRVPGRVLDVPFSNLFYPEIGGRGAWIEASHGNRTVGFFAGKETLTSGGRVTLRLQVPQTLVGSYFRQKLGSRLVVGARYVHLSNDLEALQKSPNLRSIANGLIRSNTLTMHSLYTLAGPVRWYSEAGWSGAETSTRDFGARRVRFSGMAGPLLETKRFTLKANYVYQGSSYLPLLGYYLGDRRGSYGEVKFRPFERVEIYGAANEYRNNLERNPARATFRSTSESAGASLLLPARFALSGQISNLTLGSRRTDADPLERSKNQQLTANLSRPIRRHSLRFTMRDFRQASPTFRERQRSTEVEDIFQFKRLLLGAGVRAERRVDATQSSTSLSYRGSGQFQWGLFSAYANVEAGSDLANRTVFATNTVSTTIFGGSLNLGKNWDFQVEAYRNNLLTELNPQNAFVLQGQGVFVPSVLARFNQWSLYFRLNRRFRWGKALPAGGQSSSVILQASLKGTAEGIVFQRTAEGNQPAERIPVMLDEVRTVNTDAKGYFRFTDVAEGAHKLGLALAQLPADFDPGDQTESIVVVRPNRLARADLTVVRLLAQAGNITGPQGVGLENIVIRLLPTDRYTTPDKDGAFYFYNLKPGNYTISVDANSLPPYAIMSTSGQIPVSVRVEKQPEPLSFQFEIRIPPKPVRKVLEKN